MKRIFYRANPESYPIALYQHDNGLFRVVYGKQITNGLNYARACRVLGEFLFHALSCEGKIRKENDE